MYVHIDSQSYWLLNLKEAQSVEYLSMQNVELQLKAFVTFPQDVDTTQGNKEQL